MILRDYLRLIFSVWLSVFTLINATEGERWSRQVSNSEWIPLAHPRSQIPQDSAPNNQLPPLPSIQALNLPPALRQEYQEQLHQLQRTQESIHKLLVLQQQLRSQQQLLQNQAYLPNVVGPDEEKQPFRQNSIPNAQHSALNLDGLPPPQLTAEILPAVYSSQEFKSSRQNPEAAGTHLVREESEEKSENGSNEEIQVVYVPAETLAQRGQPKEERNRDHKQFSYSQQNQRYPTRHQYQQHHQHQYSQPEQVENVEGLVNYSEEKRTPNSELVQFPRGQAETDQFFKEARQKELDRLNEERKEIQKQAKIQAAMRQREQERMRQEESAKKLKELEKIEELAKQRELDRIREEQERRHLDELKREKERVSKLKEELGRREIERLTAVERQKQSETERSRGRQKELDKYARQEEEARTKELALKKETEGLPLAEQFINQKPQHQQHHTETIKPHKRTRNKPRQRQHHHHHKQTNDQLNKHPEFETTTPIPNQPPLAVFMGSEIQSEELKIVDVLRTLRDVKSIAVLDHFIPESPKVFVGPSNLDPPNGYAKFDLPYLSSLDTNRVDKLPFFVAPLSFNPPHGYSKIPFPAPHIGSVIINNLEGNTGPSGAGIETMNKPTPNPLIEPNSFSASSGQGSTYQASYESPTVTPYSTYTQEYVTPQYQSSVYASTPVDKFRYRPQPEQQHYEQPTGPQILKHPDTSSISSYEEHITGSPRPHHSSEYTERPHVGQQTTRNDYRRPNVVTSFNYNQKQVSTTPGYQESYAHTRVQPNKEQDIVQQLAELNQHDYSKHKHIDNNYQQPSQQANVNPYHQQYHSNSNSQTSYEETFNHNPVGPPQYSLPAELPPIHPQLPGLVNSLSEQKEYDKMILPITTTPEPVTTSTTTATETPTTTYRVRIRQRGRITRPTTSTTTTTASSPVIHRTHTERSRRPFNKSRSRHTTTTEEYRETSYEATKDKVPDTTPRYNNTSESYRRSNTPKIYKFKSRINTDQSTHEPITTLNQIPNIQTHETLSDEARLTDGLSDSRQTYMQYSSPISTEGTSNAYLHQENVENPVNPYSTEIDYSKSSNYPRVNGPPRNEGSDLNNVPISQQQQQQQQYQDRFPTQSDGNQASFERQPHSRYEYDIRDDSGSTSLASPTPNDYSYYQDKIEDSRLTDSNEQIPTGAPLYTRILEYAATPQPKLQQGQLSSEDYAPSGSFDDRNRGSVENEQLYSKYSSHGYSDQQVEITTETIQTTTTTESAPVVYRQRVRARLGGRPRQESTLQTQPRGPQDEYVRFSAVNPAPNGGRQSSSSGSRSRDSPRSRSKTRTNHHGQSQVQSEGNGYVRIQSANRPASYPKTVVQTALRPLTTSTTTTTTTTSTALPIITTEESSFNDDSIEYGFIRPPNFNQAHHELSNKFRAQESPIQLQNVAPTDGTAEDSSLTQTQVPKHRQKYQSPSRPRLVIKSSTTSNPITQSSIDNSPYTTKSRVRVDEPKNRIRTKGRRPGRRRTTTTSTTTEYPLEGGNNLPIDENYPSVQVNSAELQQPLYEQKYETRHDSNTHVGSSRADYIEENYPQSGFTINFGGNPDTDGHDQSHLSHKYQSASDYPSGPPSGSRLRVYSNHPMSHERDIYGSESQWSTKLTKSSFQPVNQLNRDEEKLNSNEHASGEMKEDIPEIITAQPEDAFITVLVTSDHTENKTMNELSSSTSPSSLSESEIESADLKQKMSHLDITESNTQQIQVNSTSENSQPRRVGQRRRRVRVRVRPAPTDDFVTAESQYYNSVVNSLVQDRVKYNTHVDSSSGIQGKTPSENLAEKQERPSPLESAELSNSGESIVSTDTTTINYTEVSEHVKQSETTTLPSINSDDSMKINHSHDSMPITTEILINNFETTTNDLTTIIPLMTTMTIPRKSWDSTKAYADWIMRKMEKSSASVDKHFNDKLDNANIKALDSDSTNKLLENEAENYPKNHRSEWSEVHYPSDRGNYGYGRSEKLSPTTQLPGIVTKSVGDANVKTLSDYVQAIFDTMKNADGEGAIVDNGQNLWSDEQIKSTTLAQVDDIQSDHSAVMALGRTSSTVSSLSGDYKENNEMVETTTQQSENNITYSITNSVETSSDNLNTQMNTEVTSESPTTLSSSIAITSEPSITTTESVISSDKNSTSILTPVIRTSTTTKVSHMTEICYRGRCIMTKPKKDSYKR